MYELIMPHNVGVKNALENMKEVLALYNKVIGNYRPLLDGERYLTDKEVAQILKVSRRTLQEYRNDGVLPYVLLGGKVLYRESDLERVLEIYNMIETGLKYTSELTVTDDVTAVKMGSGDMPVLATPAMMALMENAAMMAVAKELPEGCTTVGGHIESSHLKPTKVGDKESVTELRISKNYRTQLMSAFYSL